MAKKEYQKPLLIRRLEKEQGIRVPASLIQEKTITVLDALLQKGDVQGLHAFYKHLPNKINEDSLKLLDDAFNMETNISDKDYQLIQSFHELGKGSKWFLLSISGNLLFLTKMAQDVADNNKNITDSVRCSLFLYSIIHLNELLSYYFSEIIKEYLESNEEEAISRLNFKNKSNAKRFIKNYIQMFNEKEHPTIGSTLNMISNLNKISTKGTIYDNNRKIRNQISHANMYYDETTNMIYNINGKKYSIKDIYENFQQLQHFAIAFYRLSCSSVPSKEIKKSFKAISAYFLEIIKLRKTREVSDIIKKMNTEYEMKT